MELAARKIMVTELAKYIIYINVEEPSTEKIYHQLCELKIDWTNNKASSERRRQLLEAVDAAIYEQLTILENA